jgi:hypothetical protein
MWTNPLFSLTAREGIGILFEAAFSFEAVWIGWEKGIGDSIRSA